MWNLKRKGLITFFVSIPKNQLLGVEMSEKILQLLERKGVRILLALHGKELTISELLATGNLGAQAMYRSLDVLIDLRLVGEKRGRRNARILFLTEKGQKVVQYFEEMMQVIETN